MSLLSKRYLSVSLRSNGHVLTCQDNSNNSTFDVDTARSIVLVGGEISATTMKGQSIASAEVLGNGAAQAASLVTDLTIFNNSGAASVTLAPGADGQVKYFGKTTAGNSVAITRFGGGNLVGAGFVSVTLTTAGSGATFIYNLAEAFWVLVKSQNVALA